jgi:hypothetical protein
MKTSELNSLLAGIESYELKVTVLESGSIERALEKYRAAQPRWKYVPFAHLPKTQQVEVIDLAKFIQR